MKRFSFLSLVVMLLSPLALLFLTLRLLLTPAYLELEYRLPNFPPDAYGFTNAERLHYARLALQYLLDDAPISFLEALKFPDGAPLYTRRELAHMEDVQDVVQIALRIGYSALAVLGGVGLFVIWRKEWRPSFRRGLWWGGWLTFILVLLIGLGAVTQFDQFFTLFHWFFFEGDSWLFRYSDTLIRLFPMRFWQDAFLFAGLLMCGGGMLLILTNRTCAKAGKNASSQVGV